MDRFDMSWDWFWQGQNAKETTLAGIAAISHTGKPAIYTPTRKARRTCSTTRVYRLA